MERLVNDLKYEYVTQLTVQNRMAPEIVNIPNAMFYNGALTCGPHAPLTGNVEMHIVEHGTETFENSSYSNVAEVEYIAKLSQQFPDAVIIAPYTEQCRLLLRACRREIHTLDSFQGREADVIILSVVRDGRSGSMGFWEDERRVVVAFTRARQSFSSLQATCRRGQPILLSPNVACSNQLFDCRK